MRRNRGWVMLALALLIITTACGRGPTTGIPEPWPSAKHWMVTYAHPAKQVSFIGAAANTGTGFQGMMVFNTDSSVMFTIGSHQVRVPGGSTVYVTVSPTHQHPVIAVSYRKLHGHKWYPIFRIPKTVRSSNVGQRHN
ncbi:hypothetical protein [Sulfobacillus thermosulfidooxidans]|uniref:hypothetical protein n=1 Tax=Sulfobacillus thermosulfidooxidans TaxID=28034 RepID=UPI0006B5A47B|nr:hypothetical protein [Sulfobacillus thermosulfidooxidans]